MKNCRETDFAYQAVYRYLTTLINELEVDARVRLPSLRQLAERLNVSISTIQYAYSLLEKEGRVYSIAKSGYYALPVPSMATLDGGDDLLETLYVNARRPGMQVLSADEPASMQPLDSPLLLLERELLRQYPRSSQTPSQPWASWSFALRWLPATRLRRPVAGMPMMSTLAPTCGASWKFLSRCWHSGGPPC